MEAVLIIAGHVEVPPDRRDEYVAAFVDLVRRGRAAEGCLDLAVTADLLEPGRVNIYERWASAADVERFRAVANPPNTDVPMTVVDVRLFDASGERDPFDL